MLMGDHASIEAIKEILLRRLEMLEVWFEFNTVNGIIVDSIKHINFYETINSILCFMF
jgi:hypothetical protein